MYILQIQIKKKEPIAPQSKGKEPHHFHPHIQVRSLVDLAVHWFLSVLMLVVCTLIGMLSAIHIFAPLQFPRTMYSCPQVSASLRLGTLTLSQVRSLLHYFALMTSRPLALLGLRSIILILKLFKIL